jgi:glycosyltransferase involved in cell wall biosynthesis
MKGIVLTGRVTHEKALEWFARSSIFVLPSIEDGFGMVLAEAQACGLPVIASVNSGGPDIINEADNGFLVPIRSPDTIAELLIRLSKNPEQLRAMRIAAIRKVSELRGWESFASGVLEKYRELQ